MSDRGPPTPDRWETIEAMYWRLVDRTPEERARLLADARASDPALADEVAALLDEHERAPDFLDTPVTGGRLDPPPDTGPARTVGPYRLVRPLGRGGMGEVHLAVRDVDGARHFVALKIMRRGLDTDDLVRRFQRERRILASLNHPAIARLLHVGTAGDGRPYLVMEYVEGSSLTAYARERGLDTEGRIRLFQAVCRAVQHAHQNLVVHRDLKPSNILVTPRGEPKLLDFGIAKILEGDGADGETTLLSRDVRPLTPEYASPEQFRGGMLGVSSDVYSLGVVLYELLAGTHPYPVDRSDPVAVERFVLDQDPPRPSSHAPELRGDLDNIVLKAMAREPDRRYWTPAALAEDLQRHLDGHPVQARAATLGYTLGRFVRRNRLAVGAAAALFLLLTAFSTVTALQSRRIQAESARGAGERDNALQIRTFLLEMFGTTGPDQATGDSVTARQLLDRRAASLDDAVGDPLLRAEMMEVLAQGYEKLGLYGDAEPLARTALEVRTRRLPPDDPDVAASHNTLGWVLHQAGRLQDAEPHLRAAADLGRTMYPEGHPTLARTLNDLGVNLEAQGDYAEAEAAYTEALAMRRRLLEPGDIGVAVTASNLSVVRYRQGDLEGAVAMAREAHQAFVTSLGPDHQRTMIVESNLAAMQAAMGDWPGARATYREILERRRRLFGDRHPSVAQSMVSVASAIPRGPGDEEAEALLRDALDIQTEALGPDHPTVGNTARRLAVVLSRTGRTAEARPHFERALSIQRATLGPDHAAVGETLALLAASLGDAGEYEASVAAYEEALAVQEQAYGPEHATTARTEIALVHALLNGGRLDQADPHLERAWRVLSTGLAENHLYVQEARLEAARLDVLRGDTARADSLLTRLEALLTEDQRAQLLGRQTRRLRAQLEARPGG